MKTKAIIKLLLEVIESKNNIARKVHQMRGGERSQAGFTVVVGSAESQHGLQVAK